MPVLKSALFIDFDNVFSTLDRDSEGLGKRFASKPLTWLNALEQQFEADGETGLAQRRIVSRRCYASPHRIQIYRQPFTQTGFEVIDCPPLTARMKNSADIYVVMDIVDYLTRYPHIEEFMILSADADFVPVLNRLRKELKRSIIFTSFDTAAAYRNCSDATIGSDFFRDLLAIEVTSARPVASTAQASAAGRLPKDFWERIEQCMIVASEKRLGTLPFATAAQHLREQLPELMGANWAGFGTFGAMMQKAEFKRLQADKEQQLYRLPDFKLELQGWVEADKVALNDFVFDILDTSNKAIPILTPQAYSNAFSSLAEAFNAAPDTLTEGINKAIEIAKMKDFEISLSDMRFIATGVSMQGFQFDQEDKKTAEAIANRWRVNVYYLCDEPDWLAEHDDATLLGQWFHAESESVADARRDFLDAITNSDEESP